MKKEDKTNKQTKEKAKPRLAPNTTMDDETEQLQVMRQEAKEAGGQAEERGKPPHSLVWNPRRSLNLIRFGHFLYFPVISNCNWYQLSQWYLNLKQFGDIINFPVISTCGWHQACVI